MGTTAIKPHNLQRDIKFLELNAGSEAAPDAHDEIKDKLDFCSDFFSQQHVKAYPSEEKLAARFFATVVSYITEPQHGDDVKDEAFSVLTEKTYYHGVLTLAELMRSKNMPIQERAAEAFAKDAPTLDFIEGKIDKLALVALAIADFNNQGTPALDEAFITLALKAEESSSFPKPTGSIDADQSALQIYLLSINQDWSPGSFAYERLSLLIINTWIKKYPSIQVFPHIAKHLGKNDSVLDHLSYNLMLEYIDPDRNKDTQTLTEDLQKTRFQEAHNWVVQQEDGFSPEQVIILGELGRSGYEPSTKKLEELRRMSLLTNPDVRLLQYSLIYLQYIYHNRYSDLSFGIKHCEETALTGDSSGNLAPIVAGLNRILAYGGVYNHTDISRLNVAQGILWRTQSSKYSDASQSAFSLARRYDPELEDQTLTPSDKVNELFNKSKTEAPSTTSVSANISARSDRILVDGKEIAKFPIEVPYGWHMVEIENPDGTLISKLYLAEPGDSQWALSEMLDSKISATKPNLPNTQAIDVNRYSPPAWPQTTSQLKIPNQNKSKLLSLGMIASGAIGIGGLTLTGAGIISNIKANKRGSSADPGDIAAINTALADWKASNVLMGMGAAVATVGTLSFTATFTLGRHNRNQGDE